MMHGLVAGLRGDAGETTPLGRAQAIMYRAFEEPDGPRRARLAREALAICPDCADAHVLLAEHAAGRKEALRHYEQGVAAGERALGPEVFQRDAGRFWGILETRPYMRAREGLANACWTAGRRDEAVRHLQEMLRLNPGDNQGVRYTLAGFLLFLDRDDDLARLLGQYDEGSAAWAYTRALLAFRKGGDGPEARRLLDAARKANKHVPAYLVGEKFPSEEQPPYYSHGDENEALIYVAGALAGWKSTAGAVAWLRENTAPKEPRAAAPHKGPLGFIKAWLARNLPRDDDAWQACVRQMPEWIRVGGRPARPWVILVTSTRDDLVLAHEVLVEAPSAERLWDALAQAMRGPAAGEPHRPTRLQVLADERWESLRPHLDEIGVGLDVAEALPESDEVFRSLCLHLCGEPQPGLLDMPGVTPARAAGFYDAAASFFIQMPWKKVGYESAIKVECDRFRGGPWYAVLMGQSGLATGLALYEDLGALRGMWADDGGAEENARATVATAVTFGEEWEVSVSDLEAARRHGWRVARPDAYPEIIHKERGLSQRPPLAWELELMEACLRAVPEFVARRQQDDPAREEFTVAAASGELTLNLSWVPDDPQEGA